MDSCSKQNNAPSIRTLAVNKESMRLNHWLGTVLSVSSSALALLVGRQKDIRPMKHTPLTTKVSLLDQVQEKAMVNG